MANNNPELDEKYIQVKEAIRGGAKVSHALREFKLDHGAYYGRRKNDTEPVKKGGDWSRKPKAKAPTKESKTSFIIPLESNAEKKTVAAPTERIAVIICDSTNIKNVLEGLK